jgi:glucose 1-dehydrogenase
VKRLEGKRTLVTGAARGIGRAIAERFVAEGAAVLLADIDGDEVAAVARRLDQPGRVVDVSRKSEIDALFDMISKTWGRLDVLVNNAGVTHAAILLELTEEDFDRVLAINLKAALFATQRAVPIMPAGGSIIGERAARHSDADTPEDRVLSRTPLGRFGDPSEDASYITGRTIYPDGGRLGLNYTVPVRERT